MSDEQTTDTSSQTTETTDTSATTEATSETVATETAADGNSGESDTSTVLGTATTEAGTGDADSTDEASDKGAAPEAVVPEAYDLKLTVPGEDGKDAEVAIDTALLDLATPVFKDVGLTNEQANKVAGLVPKVQEALVKQQNDAFAETRTQWAKAAQEDAEIGGQNWKSSQQLAAKALDTFVGPAVDAAGNKNSFRQLLDDTGLGNHPEMIRFCRKVGAGLAEDGTFARGTEGPRSKPSRLEALYPNDVKK